jgi:hypothetical protein
MTNKRQYTDPQQFPLKFKGTIHPSFDVATRTSF